MHVTVPLLAGSPLLAKKYTVYCPAGCEPVVTLKLDRLPNCWASAPVGGLVLVPPDGQISRQPDLILLCCRKDRAPTVS